MTIIEINGSYHFSIKFLFYFNKTTALAIFNTSYMFFSFFCFINNVWIIDEGLCLDLSLNFTYLKFKNNETNQRSFIYATSNLYLL